MGKSPNGFTIIEIVVALVVVGILMGATATQLNRFRATAYQTAANNMALSIQQAVNMKYSSIFQVLASSPAARCTREDSMCAGAYDGALIMLTQPDSTGKGMDICGLQFYGNNAPFAQGAELGGGWRISADKVPYMGGPVDLTGPDGKPYTAEVRMLTAAEMCGS